MITVITLVSAAMVLAASFCRLTKTNARTVTPVRLAIWALAAVSMTVIAAPLLWHWSADIAHAGIFTALASYQIATRRTWQHGVPEWFTRMASP